MHYVGYTANLRLCEREDEIVDWMKTKGRLRCIQYRSVACPGLVCYSCTLVRMVVNLRPPPQAWPLQPEMTLSGILTPKRDSTRKYSAFPEPSPPFLYTRTVVVDVIQNPFCTLLTP